MITRRRCLLVWGALTATTGATARWAWPAVGPAQRFDELVASVAGVALVACAAWAWLVCTVVVVQALRCPGRPPRVVRGVPRWVSRGVLAACGLAVVTAVPAGASYDVHHPPRHASTASVDGLPFPDRAVGPSGAARAPGSGTPPPPPRQTSQVAGTLVVRPGDSLWRLAEGLLGPGAPDAEVAATTTALYDLNRAAVGPDPDLIQPGLRLRTPGS